MQVIRESTAEEAVNGVWGWVDDDLAFIRPWGFDVTEIGVRVLVRYGSTDVLVPPAHGKWLAENVPGSVVKVDDVAGHLGADPEQEIAENMRWLRDGVPPPGIPSAGREGRRGTSQRLQRVVADAVRGEHDDSAGIA